ncbi:YkgJ family cysteine cluster protein [Dehalogenimonas sp. THU2]|uniref:YkgJ family cysteine cluster protein n=1 Tax=Dehalogenimonas sp. THU2 TaxID=3151121 RepID=UPI003218462D
MGNPEEQRPQDFLGAVRKIVAKETAKKPALPDSASNTSSIEPVRGLTRFELEKNWDEEAARNGVERIMGISSLRFNKSNPFWGQGKLMDFLPLYLVARFLKCQQCSRCCRPNFLYWDKGVVLSREEALRLKHLCKLEKRNGVFIMKYPCPLLNGKHCRHYRSRPAGCRLFPFNRWYDDAAGEEGLGVLMHCPAAKEFYVTVSLFMPILFKFVAERVQAGAEGFTFEDLDVLSAKFGPNKISPEDLNYILEKAGIS